VADQHCRVYRLLERSTVYRDRVGGEEFPAWGAAEARRLGVHEALLGAGGIHHRRFVPYDETLTPAAAVAASIALGRLFPDIPGTLGVLLQRGRRSARRR